MGPLPEQPRQWSGTSTEKSSMVSFNSYQDVTPGCVTSLLNRLEWEPLQHWWTKNRLHNLQYPEQNDWHRSKRILNPWRYQNPRRTTHKTTAYTQRPIQVLLLPKIHQEMECSTVHCLNIVHCIYFWILDLEGLLILRTRVILHPRRVRPKKKEEEIKACPPTIFLLM